jgi:hypothetical protein
MQLKKLGDGTSFTNEIGPITDCVMFVFSMTQTNPERLCESSVVAPSNCNLTFIKIGVGCISLFDVDDGDFITRGSESGLAMPSSVRGCSPSDVVYRLVLCSSVAIF